MESPFAAWMDRLYLEQPDRVTPDEANDELQIYADAGIARPSECGARSSPGPKGNAQVPGPNKMSHINEDAIPRRISE